MKGYFSIDIETTGLDPNKHKVLEIACLYIKVGETPNLEKLNREGRVFHVYLNVSVSDIVNGDKVAIEMNKKTIEDILNKSLKSYITRSDFVMPKLEQWARKFIDKETERMVVAGKNFGVFDYQFLKNLPNWNNSLMSRRFLDPSMFYINFKEDDFSPSLETCLERAGMDSHVNHTAVDDALQVAQLINAAYKSHR